MGISLLRAAGYRRMPWKNGGGETTEIAVFPSHAGLSDFGWRVSMAKVAGDGPFSIFPEIDRTLCVLEGNGIELSIAGKGVVRLDPASEPLAFPADVAINARLTDGAITDLNVMTRRGVASHRVSRIDIDGAIEWQAAGAPTLVFCQYGTLELEADGERADLSALDCALVEAPPAGPLRLSGNARCFVVEILYG